MDYQRILAETYDALYGVHRDPVGDVAFYTGLARAAAGPVLDLGTGTGRMLAPIAAEGLPIVGVDPSEEMLRVLARKVPGAVVHQQTMQALDLPERGFALAICAFRAFQHLLTVEDELEALTRIRHHLRPGGRLALDVFDPNPTRMGIAHEPETDDTWFESDGRRILRRYEVHRQRHTQTMDIAFRYYDTEGASLGVSPISMRWIWRFELEHLLVRSGFRPLSWSSRYDGSPYDGTGDIVVVAERT